MTKTLRIVEQGGGDDETLAGAVGEVLGEFVAVLAEMEFLEELAGALGDDARAPAGKGRRRTA